MKSHIRAMLDDLMSPKKEPLPCVVPEDLDNQILSDDPLQKVRQLDEQAQLNEERETLT